MGLLDRFRQNRQKSVLPAEVREYYQAEQRQKRGVAIGLAILAVIITIAVAAGLFFGGRFVYRQIKGDDNKGKTSSTSTNKPSDQTNNDTQKSTDGTSQPQTQPTTPAPGSTSTPTPTPTPPAPAPKPAPTTTPRLGDNPNLPHTGDEGL